MLVDDDEIDVLVHLHPKTDFGEGCVPVGWQLGFVSIKSSFSFGNVEGFIITPEVGIVVKGCLRKFIDWNLACELSVIEQSAGFYKNSEIKSCQI